MEREKSEVRSAARKLLNKSPQGRSRQTVSPSRRKVESWHDELVQQGAKGVESRRRYSPEDDSRGYRPVHGNGRVSRRSSPASRTTSRSPSGERGRRSPPYGERGKSTPGGRGRRGPPSDAGSRRHYDDRSERSLSDDDYNEVRKDKWDNSSSHSSARGGERSRGGRDSRTKSRSAASDHSSLRVYRRIVPDGHDSYHAEVYDDRPATTPVEYKAVPAQLSIGEFKKYMESRRQSTSERSHSRSGAEDFRSSPHSSIMSPPYSVTRWEDKKEKLKPREPVFEQRREKYVPERSGYSGSEIKRKRSVAMGGAPSEVVRNSTTAVKRSSEKYNVVPARRSFGSASNYGSNGFSPYQGAKRLQHPDSMESKKTRVIVYRKIDKDFKDKIYGEDSEWKKPIARPTTPKSPSPARLIRNPSPTVHERDRYGKRAASPRRLDIKKPEKRVEAVRDRPHHAPQQKIITDIPMLKSRVTRREQSPLISNLVQDDSKSEVSIASSESIPESIRVQQHVITSIPVGPRNPRPATLSDIQEKMRKQTPSPETATNDDDSVRSIPVTNTYASRDPQFSRTINDIASKYNITPMSSVDVTMRNNTKADSPQSEFGRKRRT